ncbi:CLUMA_CG009457, isoform A [Clunio marinus]|uniref:CLUMA_CG009457, isoform A n=1 Tax=Clunio marinus TaxID=568069 RepID=A0A1J1IC54_9DIPT|nr:CLUMA_CG009457, isoform A [Clunio marinus]
MSTTVEVIRNQNGINDLKKESFHNTSQFILKFMSQNTFDMSCMVLAEFLGTAALIFFGCAGGIHWNGDPGPLIPPLNFGFIVLFIVQMFGHISYALLNPSVVICAVVNNLISVKTAILHVIAEIFGAIFGYGLLMFVTPSDIFSLSPEGICMTLVHPEVSVSKAFLVEFILTSTLITIISGAWDPRNRNNTDSTAIRIGLAVAALSIAGGPYSGASMNPARSLGPALWNWKWENHWIYWVSPLSAVRYLKSQMAISEDPSRTGNVMDNRSSSKLTETIFKIENTSTKQSKLRWHEDLMKQEHLDLLTKFLAEVIGTGLLVFIGCMGCVSGFGFEPNHYTIVTGFGLAVMLIINIFGCVSGAHLNPAISLAAVVYKLMTPTTAIVYSIGQLLGGYLGYGLLMVLTPREFTSGDGFCVSAAKADTFTALIVEFIITSVLILVYCAVIDPRNAKYHDSVALRFGLTVACLALVGGPYSGGSMNPARSFGPALYNWNWANHWIYWIGPMAGGLVTSVVFRTVFYREPPREEALQIEEHPLNDKNNV